jgi:hypothetical protein
MDVLDALSFRVMVLDHIKNKYKNEGGNIEELDSNLEMEIKNDLSQEVNKLIY